jgi:prophage maintenance system killer protein
MQAQVLGISAFDRAAAYVFHFQQNDRFMAGHKRIAVATALAFLAL